MDNILFKTWTEQVLYNHSVYEAPMQCSHFVRHLHSFYEILYFIKGDATYVIEDRQYKLKKHDLILIHPNLNHYIRIESNVPYERYNLAFTAEDMGDPLARRLPSLPEHIHCGDRVLHDIFLRIESYRTKLDEKAFYDLLHGITKEILYNLSFASADTEQIPTTVSPLLSKALQYINDNLFTISSVTEISDFLYITESYFFKLFKEQMKISPMKYITDKRLLAAQNMIASGKKPTEVYLLCGFRTYPAFYKRYVDYFDCAPSQKQVTVAEMGH